MNKKKIARRIDIVKRCRGRTNKIVCIGSRYDVRSFRVYSPVRPGQTSVNRIQSQVLPQIRNDPYSINRRVEVESEIRAFQGKCPSSANRGGRTSGNIDRIYSAGTAESEKLSRCRTEIDSLDRLSGLQARNHRIAQQRSGSRGRKTNETLAAVAGDCNGIKQLDLPARAWCRRRVRSRCRRRGRRVADGRRRCGRRRLVIAARTVYNPEKKVAKRNLECIGHSSRLKRRWLSQILHSRPEIVIRSNGDVYRR